MENTFCVSHILHPRKEGNNCQCYGKVTCDNYFIIKYFFQSNMTQVFFLTSFLPYYLQLASYIAILTWYKQVEVKTASTNFICLYYMHLTDLYIHNLIWIFCTLFCNIWFVFNYSLLLIYFLMFSIHSSV